MSIFIDCLKEFYQQTEIETNSILQLDNDTSQFDIRSHQGTLGNINFKIEKNIFYTDQNKDYYQDIINFINSDNVYHAVILTFQVKVPISNVNFNFNSITNGTKTINYHSYDPPGIKQEDGKYNIIFKFNPLLLKPGLEVSYTLFQEDCDCPGWPHNLDDLPSYVVPKGSTTPLDVSEKLGSESKFYAIGCENFSQIYIAEYKDGKIYFPYDTFDVGEYIIWFANSDYPYTLQSINLTITIKLIIKNNKIDKETYYNNNDKVIKLSFSVEKVGEIYLSLYYFFNGDETQKKTLSKQLSGSGEETVQFDLQIPKFSNNGKQKLEFYCESQSVRTTTLSNDFNFFYHSPVLSMSNQYDPENIPLYIYDINSTFDLSFSLSDNDLNDFITVKYCLRINGSSEAQTIQITSSKTNYDVKFTISLNKSFYEGVSNIFITATDSHTLSSSIINYTFYVKQNTPEIMFNTELKKFYSKFDNKCIRISLLFRDIRGSGNLSIATNISSSSNPSYHDNKTEVFSVTSRDYQLSNIFFPLENFYPMHNYTLKITSKNDHDEYSNTLSSTFYLLEPTLDNHNIVKRDIDSLVFGFVLKKNDIFRY